MSQELEDRFFNYAKRVRDFCARLDMNVINREYIGQLIRASGSVAANYIEASDSLGKNDERMKLRTSRREAKESTLWLKLLLISERDEDLENERQWLINEAEQIKKILSSIILKVG
jgi:four helix bundle protein